MAQSKSIHPYQKYCYLVASASRSDIVAKNFLRVSFIIPESKDCAYNLL